MIFIEVSYVSKLLKQKKCVCLFIFRMKFSQATGFFNVFSAPILINLIPRYEKTVSNRAKVIVEF